MTNEPIDLDEHRGMAALKATEIRRERLHEFEADQAALQRHKEELEHLLLASPAQTWSQAAAKAKYLLHLFATTPEAQDRRRQELIAQAVYDLNRLCDRAEEPS